jgi:hypothetical protein
MTSKPCPYPCCPRPIYPDQYACRAHWYGLPRWIRDTIWEGYLKSATIWTRGDTAARDFWNQKLSMTTEKMTDAN